MLVWILQCAGATSKELFGSWYHEMFQDILVNCYINRRFEEAEVINTSWWHRTPSHNRLWKLHISLEAANQVPFTLFFHTLRLLFLKEITNLDSSENLTEDHCFFVLPAPLQPLLPLFGIEQRFYSWHAAAESLFMQPSMYCLDRCLLPRRNQLLGAAKPILFSQSSQLAIISLRGTPFPATVLPIAAYIS